MRFDITHLTEFGYEGSVAESHNELRACPSSAGRQTVLHYRVQTDPGSDVESHVDWFGTRVDTFGVREPHDHLEVRAEATVDVGAAPQPTEEVPLSALADQDFRDRRTEWLSPTKLVAWQGELGAWARDVAVGADGVLDLAKRVEAAVHGRLAYERGRTDATTDAVTVFAEEAGVCQDFAHLALAAFRCCGLPARYVSGYFFARDPMGDEVVDDQVLAETHAWVQVAVPGFGWWGLDPTNGGIVGERHVKIGHGRDYTDVVPLRGVYVGPPGDEPRVTVDMRRQSAVQQQQ